MWFRFLRWLVNQVKGMMTLSTCTRSSSPTAPSRPRQRICNKHSSKKVIGHLQQEIFGIFNKKYLASSTKIFGIYFKKGKLLATRNVLTPFSESLDRQQEIFVTRPESLQVQNRKYASSYQLIDASAELIISEIKFQWLNPWPFYCKILWAKQTGMVWLHGIGKVR